MLQTSGVRLVRVAAHDPPPRQCDTVYTVIQGSYSAAMAVRYEHRLFARIAEQLLGLDAQPDDALETCKEYLNIVCGRVISEIHRQTGRAARCRTPLYYRQQGGLLLPKPITTSLCYQSDRAEAVEILWMTFDQPALLPSQKGACAHYEQNHDRR